MADTVHLITDRCATPLEHVKVERETGLLGRGPHRLPHVVPHRHHRAPRHKQHPRKPELGAVFHLLGRHLGVMVGNTAKTKEPAGPLPVELSDELVVSVINRAQQLAVLDTRVLMTTLGDGDDAVDDLGLYPVTFHIFQTLGGIGGSQLITGGKPFLDEDPSSFATGYPGSVVGPRANGVVSRHPHIFTFAGNYVGNRIAPLGIHPLEKTICGQVGDVQMTVG